MEVNQQNFQSAVIDRSQQRAVVVQFWAPWCGPCRSLKPVLKEVKQSGKHEIDLAFVNVRDNQQLANQFGIVSIPDVKLIQFGEVVASFVGFKPAYVIDNWLDNHLSVQADSPTYPLENKLSNNQIDEVKSGLLEMALQERPDSDYIKILLALQQAGKNNPQALQWLSQVDRYSQLGPLVKRLRDHIEMDVEDRDTSTPTSSPYTLEPEDLNAKIEIPSFNQNLLADLVHYGLNAVRKKQGLAQLQTHQILNQAANDQNNYQLKTDTLSHYQKNPSMKTVRERVDRFGGGFRVVGENVQYKGFPMRKFGPVKEIVTPTYLQAAEDLIQNWVNSPGHYRNMIHPDYQYVGTAIGWNPENAAIFATQVFGA